MTGLRKMWHSAAGVVATTLLISNLHIMNNTGAAHAKPSPQNTASQSQATSNKPFIADRHTVFIQDCSDSLGRNTCRKALEAIKNQLLVSDTIKTNLNNGVKYGLSLIVFGNQSFHAGTMAIQSEKDLHTFIAYFWDSEKKQLRNFSEHKLNDIGTDLARALNLTADIFANEKNYHIDGVLSREILVLTDNTHGRNAPAIIQNVRKIGVAHGATVSIVPFIPSYELDDDDFVGSDPDNRTLKSHKQKWANDLFLNRARTPSGLKTYDEAQQYIKAVHPGYLAWPGNLRAIPHAVEVAMEPAYF